MLAHSQMLRASTQATSAPLDARAVVDPSVDPLLPAGNRLIFYVDAVLCDPAHLSEARTQLLAEVGPSGVVDAAAVIGNFEMMNRIADATGMPVGKGALKRSAEWRAHLGLDRFNHSAD